MTLIHDYNGDPNTTYYNSHFLAAGWLSKDPTWSVHTAEETYQGTISITRATTVSDNTVFAQLAADLGWSKLDQTAHAMGITSPLDGNPAEVIGGLRIGVTPLEMADAYATIGDGGSATRRRDQPGRVPGREPVAPRQTRGQRGLPDGRRTRRPGAQDSRHPGHRHRRRLRLPRAPARPEPPRTSRTPGSSATRRSSRPRSGSAIRKGTCRWPTASAARSRRRSGTTTCRRRPTATAATSRTPTVAWQGQPFFGNFAVTGNAKLNQNQNGSTTTTSTASTTPTSPTTSANPGPTTTGPPRGGGNVGAPPGYGTGHRPAETGTEASLARGVRCCRSRPFMPKEEKVELEGEVVEALPNAMFRVKLDNMDRVVLGHVAGKMRRFRIRILPGDRVRVELSPYDLDRARIVYRHR